MAPSERHGLHLAAVGREHAVAHEAVAHAGLHADLADPSWRSPSTVAITSLAVFSARTISSSRMMLAGEKKCSPTTSCGRLVAGGDLVDVEGGGVGGDDGARLGDLVELARTPPS